LPLLAQFQLAIAVNSAFMIGGVDPNRGVVFSS
jgi:hypothetical protein